MRSRILIIWCMLVAIASLWGSGCNKSDDSPQRATPLDFPKPAGWPDTRYDFASNPLTKEGFELGRKLFFDGRLSKDGNFPCASCHQPFAAFATFEHDFSHGFNNQFTTRNAPALFNLAWHTEMHHDGGIANLDLQPLAPLTAPNEMAETIPSVLEKLNADPQYQKDFARAFGSPEISTSTLTKALSQFMLMLVSADSKYDRVKNGSDLFNVNEEAGYAIFQQKCSSCHTEPLFTNLAYEKNGLPVNPDLNDLGRMRITGSSQDSLRFKVPSLRNVLKTFPYMHDGRFWNLSDVYTHYNGNGISLSPVERSFLTEFLRTLTDSTFLSDQKFSGGE
ncbi:cytochrome C peroxidase [Flavihumibacter solisilvae]|uniref:Cytochrome C peroxidase n=2 Tax=Flavihumibacter solisilvae TaxID=1349421 RepID=A0A0C1IPK4_9BACT|nr:cytochrome C peroxidase [Flavihumibacter solisilvae]